MVKAYLTIDDGPSEKFTHLIDALAERQIPAVFFNRGDLMERNPEAVLYGISKGYVMGNHAYSHKRASQCAHEDVCADIMKAQKILDDMYARAGVENQPRYFRFPYMDRGMGPCLVEPVDDLPESYAKAIDHLLHVGLGHDYRAPTDREIENKRRLQVFLKESGFAPVPFKNVRVPWYAQTEMAGAIDSLCTFSTSDWALCERHRGKYGFHGVSDLKRHIDRDFWLQDGHSHHIILLHDQAEIHDAAIELIDYMLQNNFEFLAL